jgi:hypothetical protein
MESHGRMWVEFSFRVDTSGELLRTVMTSHCVKAWGDFIGVSDGWWLVTADTFYMLQLFSSILYATSTPPALELRFGRVRRRLVTLLAKLWSNFAPTGRIVVKFCAED